MEKDKIRELTPENLEGVVGGTGDWKTPDSDKGKDVPGTNNVPLDKPIDRSFSCPQYAPFFG